MAKTYFKRQGNKFNAKTSNYNGRTYHSKKEADYAMELDWLKKAGQIKTITPQFKISLDVYSLPSLLFIWNSAKSMSFEKWSIIFGTEHIANYYMDFKVELPDGRIEMHEVKGMETDTWRMKWRLAKALYPEWNFVLIK
jgi:hypothetical protein